MDFVLYINTPKDTPKNAPKITKLKITAGRLTGGFLYFPSGAAGTLHFQARIGLHQILPFNSDENYRLDDCVVPFSLGIDILEPPFQIDCVTWNESISYAHALTVCFFLSPSKRKRFGIDTLKKAFSISNGYQKA